MVSDEQIERLKDAIEGECDGLSIDDAHARAILEYVLASPPAVPVEPAANMLDPDSDDAQGLAAPEGWWKGLYRGTEDVFDLVRFAAGLDGLADHEVLEELERRAKAAPSAPLVEVQKFAAIAQVIEAAPDELEARIRWLLNPMPVGATLYEEVIMVATQPADHQGEQE